MKIITVYHINSEFIILWYVKLYWLDIIMKDKNKCINV